MGGSGVGGGRKKKKQGAQLKNQGSDVSLFVNTPRCRISFRRTRGKSLERASPTQEHWASQPTNIVPRNSPCPVLFLRGRVDGSHMIQRGGDQAS